MKNHLFGLIVLGLSLALSFNTAAADQESSFKKELFNGCVAGYTDAAQGRLSGESALKFCECVLDKTLANYTDDDLKAMETDQQKLQNFKKDLENNMTSKDCFKIMLEGLKK